LPFAKEESVSRLLEDQTVKDFISTITSMNKSTAVQYVSRLNIFNNFLNIELNIFTMDNLINKIKEGSIDPYSILSRFCAFLKNSNNNLSTITIKQRVVTVKNFFEYCDIDINPKKFKLKVRIPKTVRKNKEALSKKDVIDILNNCSDIRLKTYVMVLAATGMRATEALHIQVKDIDFDNKPAIIRIRGENTKTKTDRIIFLTDEVTNQLNTWLKYKHRTRRICYQNKNDDVENNKKTITVYRTPNIKNNDLVFSAYQSDQTPDPRSLYTELLASFGKTLDRMGKGERENKNERRRQITLHSFRRFVKSTISDLGYSDYSEWFIGHSGSTYYRKKESEKIEIFRKIEPYLTFLNVYELERQGADIQSKIDELEILNQSLRERDKTKDDSISMLADQILTLTERLKELERKQQSQQFHYG
jgi:integrase